MKGLLIGENLYFFKLICEIIHLLYYGEGK